MGYPNKSIKNRLNRIKGQINGIDNMLQQQRECTEVVAQIQAARASLAALGEQVIGSEAECCVQEDDSEQQVQRLRQLVKQLFKLS